MTPMSSLNSSNDGGGNVAIRLQRKARGVGVSCRWRSGGALEMEVSLITGGCSNVGITYTVLSLSENIFVSIHFKIKQKSEIRFLAL